MHIFLTMYTFEEYIDFYKKHGCLPDNPIRNKNAYTEKQLITKYKKYESKHNSEGMSKDDLLRQQCRNRDRGCRLWKVLTPLERATTEVPFKNLDMAHIFPKKAYPHMRYNLDNVVLLYRTFHNRLDEQKHPLTGKMISKEECLWWWKRIVGEDLWEKLEKESENGKQRC